MKNNEINENPALSKMAVSGSFFEILDTIHDNLIDKGYDCFNSDGSIKEVDEYKLNFKSVSDELKKYCIKTEIKKLLQNKLIVNGFEVSQVKNSDGNNLSSNFLQWQAKDLFSDLIFFGQNKKECISWSENYR